MRLNAFIIYDKNRIYFLNIVQYLILKYFLDYLNGIFPFYNYTRI